MKCAVVSSLVLLLLVAICSAAGGQTVNADSILMVYDSLNPEHVELRNEAVEYYNELAEGMPELKKARFQYTQAMTRLRKARAVDKKRQEVLMAIAKMKESSIRQKPFRGDSTLKCGYIEYYDLTTIVLKKDFGKILDMEDIKEQTYDEDEAHQLAIDMALEKLNKYIDFVNKVEDDYFKKHHIVPNSEKDAMSLQIERGSNAIHYYNEVHRLYRKSNKEYYYARQSVGAKDVAGMEQHSAALLSFVQEGLEKLKLQSHYEGDGSLIVSAKALLEFYQQEAQKGLPANVDFNLKSDNMQKANKKLNATKQQDRTKADVEEFNNAVKDYNNAVKDINSMNNASFKKHGEFLDQWKKEMEKFFKKHT